MVPSHPGSWLLTAFSGRPRPPSQTVPSFRFFVSAPPSEMRVLGTSQECEMISTGSCVPQGEVVWCSLYVQLDLRTPCIWFHSGGSGTMAVFLRCDLDTSLIP